MRGNLIVGDVLREAISRAGKDPEYKNKFPIFTVVVDPFSGFRPIRSRGFDTHINVVRRPGELITGELIFSGYWVDDEHTRSDVVLSLSTFANDKCSYVTMGTFMTLLSHYVWQIISENPDRFD